MTPTEEFSRDENNRKQLAALLASPILKQAITLLLDELQPNSTNPGVSNPVVSAACFQQLAGANHIIKGLKRLTEEDKPRVRIAPRELLPEPPITDL
jgi:hypothetical protein